MRLLRLSFALLVLFACAAFSQEENLAIIDATTGHVLEARGGNAKVQVASLTKVATGIVVLDWCEASSTSANTLVTISPAAISEGGLNPVGFQPGDTVSVRDLLYAALMQSDNVAALSLAEFVGKSLSGEGSPTDRFVAQMNALARTLQMNRTLFLNPHGLDNAERKLPYSTALDMAKLGRAAMAKSAFRFYVSQREREITLIHPDGLVTGYVLRNTNELLGLNRIDGVKTGMTRRAGGCVMISAARAPESRQEGETHIITPRRLVVVVLGAESRFKIASSALERGWQLYDQWAAEGRPLRTGFKRQ